VGVGAGVGVGIGVDVVAGLSAVTIACRSAAERDEKFPMPPVLLLIADCNRARVIPVLLDVAKAP
jgi:hypothetical protein